jgi:hypothetical protein
METHTTEPVEPMEGHRLVHDLPHNNVGFGASATNHVKAAGRLSASAK